MAVVRNSVGSECYVADELIVSRAGEIIYSFFFFNVFIKYLMIKKIVSI